MLGDIKAMKTYKIEIVVFYYVVFVLLATMPQTYHSLLSEVTKMY